MDTQRLQELIATIEESNGALWRILVQLDKAKTMLPNVPIAESKIKLNRSMHALAELKKELEL